MAKKSANHNTETNSILNFRYDAAGFFGRDEKSPCDTRSVLEKGLSVCAGYANVIEDMCK